MHSKKSIKLKQDVITSYSIHYTKLYEDDRNVYLKLFIPGDNVYYYGLYKGHEEKVNDLYVLITDYEVRDYSDNLIADYTGNRTRWATINTKNISRVEIIYSKYSERNKKVIKNKK